MANRTNFNKETGVGRLKSLDNLEIKNLKKIRQSLEIYQAQKKSYSQFNKQVRAKRQELRLSEEVLHRELAKIREPIIQELRALYTELMQHKASSLTSFFSNRQERDFDVPEDLTLIRGFTNSKRVRFRGKEAFKIIERIDQLKIELGNAYYRAERTTNYPLYREESLTPKKPPKPFTILKLSGVSTKVYFSDFSIDQISKLIQLKQAEELSKKEAFKRLQARAFRHESDVRSQARKYQKELLNQLRNLSSCPYCNGELHKGNAHQDHIHPVSKGGLSISENLVYVCSACNLKKRDKTLRVFLRDENLDLSAVFSRLDILGKH